MRERASPLRTTPSHCLAAHFRSENVSTFALNQRVLFYAVQNVSNCKLEFLNQISSRGERSSLFFAGERCCSSQCVAQVIQLSVVSEGGGATCEFGEASLYFILPTSTYTSDANARGHSTLVKRREIIELLCANTFIGKQREVNRRARQGTQVANENHTRQCILCIFWLAMIAIQLLVTVF